MVCLALRCWDVFGAIKSEVAFAFWGEGGDLVCGLWKLEFCEYGIAMLMLVVC